MSRSAESLFAAHALALSFQTRFGRVPALVDQLRLARLALDLGPAVAEREIFQGAASAFLRDAAHDPVSAGLALDAVVAAHGPMKAPAPPRFDWQDRADLR